jgi:hypothetical protein
VQDLSHKYLPAPETVDPDDTIPRETTEQDLAGFVRAVRHSLDAIHRRQRLALKVVEDSKACFEGLNTTIGHTLPVAVHVALLEHDASILGVTIETHIGDDEDSYRVELGRIEIGLDGAITKAVFRDQEDNARCGGAEAAARAGDGRLDGLLRRILDYACSREGDATTPKYVEEVLGGRSRLVERRLILGILSDCVQVCRGRQPWHRTPMIPAFLQLLINCRNCCSS